MSWLFEFLGLLFAGVGIITYFIGRKQAWREAEEQYGKIAKHGEKMKTELKEELTEDVVNVANAQLRVKDGGKVARRDNKIIGAHERTVSENVNIGENVVVSKKSVRKLNEDVPISDLVVTGVIRAKDRFVAENVKKFSVDAILTTSEPPTDDKTDKDNTEKST